MKTLVVDFNNDIYKATGIRWDSTSMQEVPLLSDDGQQYLLQVIKINTAGKETLYLSLKNMLGEHTPDFNCKIGVDKFNIDSSVSQDSVVIENIKDGEPLLLQINSPSFKVDMGLQVVLEGSQHREQESPEAELYKTLCPEKTHENNQQKIAWDVARKERVCPSDSELFLKPTSARKLNRHVKKCNLCQERIALQEYMPSWKELATRVQAGYPQAIYNVKMLPSIGQVWSVKAKLNGWVDADLFYNAPMVLLIEHDRYKKNTLQVAQIYSDKALMNQGDVWLGDDYGFAESWNTYSINVRHLGTYWGEVDQKMIQTVRDGSGKPSTIKGYDYFNTLFRNLEKDVGSFFADKSSQIIEEEKKKVACRAWLKEKAKRAIDQIVKDLVEFAVNYLIPEKQPQWAGIAPTGADIPEQIIDFQSDKGKIELRLYWAPRCGNTRAFIRIKWIRHFSSSEKLWVRFINPSTKAVRKEINLGTVKENENNYDTDYLGFDPSCEEWAIYIALVESATVVDGVKRLYTNQKDQVLILSGHGLKKLSHHLASELRCGEEGIINKKFLKRGKTLPRKAIDRLEQLKESFPILPINLKPMQDNLLKITFKRFGYVPDKKPKVLITLRGNPISQKDIRWETWKSSEPVLAIRNCDITLKEIETAKQLMAVNVNEDYNAWIINLL